MSVADAVTSSLWFDQVAAIQPRPPLQGDVDVDVAIVGGGYSGLWTAYYLRQIDPTLRIQIIEKHYCGYGASGRNGGWAVGDVAGSFESYAKRSSPQEVVRQTRAVFDSVDEIGRVAESISIDCDYQKGGWIRVARNAPQAQRQRDEVAHARSIGMTEDDLRLLEPDEARTHMSASRVSGGIFFAHCAALHPAKLVRGLADHLATNGISIAEGTTASALDGNKVETVHGTVRADVVIRATEGYTRDLHGERRTLLPVYSLMIATEPLSDDVLADIGLDDRPTFSDDRFMVIYGQRTADGRLAFGGRGVPYLWGSKITRSAELHLPSHELLRDTLIDLLPGLGEVKITHRWGGVLGIPRNWVPGLRFDRSTGQGVLGGYVGEGVAASNLAGRTMADLITGQDTDRTSLPWVGVNARRWEPEPFRWLGVRSSRSIMNRADVTEERTDKEAKTAYRISRLLRGA